MIEVGEALRLVLSHTRDPGIEEVPLEEAAGRILQEDLSADADFPPFDRVMMDGIAVAFDAIARGQTKFQIEKTQAAGQPQSTLENADRCVEIMTGAVRPEGTDVVIPYEDLDIQEGTAHVKADISAWRKGKNVHRKGTDVRAGDVLLEKGRWLDAAEIGVAASIGKARIQVARRFRAAVLSSGNELIGVGEKPQPHQIRKSNVYGLKAALGYWGIDAQFFHLDDDPESMRRVLSHVLHNHDVLLMSGGVSMGKYDYVPDILTSLGVDMLFHKVNQKPGKPFWFGKTNTCVVFAFPGNPVSTMVCFRKYCIPWLSQSTGAGEEHAVLALLGEDCANRTGKTFFVPAKTFIDENGRVVARLHRGKGSGDHANLTRCNGFVELEGGTVHHPRGALVPFLSFRQYNCGM